MSLRRKCNTDPLLIRKTISLHYIESFDLSQLTVFPITLSHWTDYKCQYFKILQVREEIKNILKKVVPELSEQEQNALIDHLTSKKVGVSQTAHLADVEGTDMVNHLGTTQVKRVLQAFKSPQCQGEWFLKAILNLQ